LFIEIVFNSNGWTLSFVYEARNDV